MSKRSAASKPKTPRISVVRTELVPIAKLKPFAGNARRGDVNAIEESVNAHGQYKPLVGNLRTGEVLVGNHSFKALKRAGAKQVLVSWVDVDKAEARRINLVDNATSDRATMEDQALSRLLEQARSSGGLEGTGYSDKMADRLLARVRQEMAPSTPAGDQTGELTDSFQLIVRCRNEQQQAALIERLTGEGYDVRALIT